MKAETPLTVTDEYPDGESLFLTHGGIVSGLRFGDILDETVSSLPLRGEGRKEFAE